MKFRELPEVVGGEPVFETALLLAGDVSPAQVRQQPSRWVNRGLICKIRRGLYAVAPPFQRRRPHPFHVANRMVRESYVSCSSALAHYGPVVRPRRDECGHRAARSLGDAAGPVRVSPDQTRSLGRSGADAPHRWTTSLRGHPEKALLDLLYLFPHSNSPEYLCELRLQNLDRLDAHALTTLSETTRSRKLKKAARHVLELAESESLEYEALAD